MSQRASKLINTHVFFLGLPTGTKLNFIKLITQNHIIWFIRRESLVQLVGPRRTRAEIICWRVDSLVVGVIHACE